MATAIKRNSYGFPNGYTNSRYTRSPANTAYIPWNSSLISASPARRIIGASQVFNIASVPADLSTFILNAPNGQAFTFQFVYNASVQTQGIKIPLPLSGGSTAAQTLAAITGVLNAAGGTPLGGQFVAFPWNYVTTGAAQFRIDWTMKLAAVPATGTQATITAGAVTAPTFGFAAVVPGSSGKRFAWLHGA